MKEIINSLTILNLESFLVTICIIFSTITIMMLFAKIIDRDGIIVPYWFLSIVSYVILFFLKINIYLLSQETVFNYMKLLSSIILKAILINVSVLGLFCIALYFCLFSTKYFETNKKKKVQRMDN